MTEAWNEAYVSEAGEIAATVVDQDGRYWLADQIRTGKQPRRQEVRVAMLALMVARGEYNLKRP
jgi:hypothetical protein